MVVVGRVVVVVGLVVVEVVVVGLVVVEVVVVVDVVATTRGGTVEVGAVVVHGVRRFHH